MYSIDEEFAAGIRRRLQQWAKTQRRAKVNSIQAISNCIFQSYLFNRKLGDGIPVLPQKGREGYDLVLPQ